MSNFRSLTTLSAALDKEQARNRALAAHVHEQAEQAARQAAMQRHPSVVAKRLAFNADGSFPAFTARLDQETAAVRDQRANEADMSQYVERSDDDTMPTADQVADMLAWGEQA